MTKIINWEIDEGKAKGKTDKEILFAIQLVVYEAEVDLKSNVGLHIEDIFNPRKEVELPKGICRLKLDGDCPDLLFLN
ncbi:MAG: hypothetical protein IT221_15445 [Fluviicola sp.]|nr:hypothetical protein [Fluviicola sp.]